MNNSHIGLSGASHGEYDLEMTLIAETADEGLEEYCERAGRDAAETWGTDRGEAWVLFLESHADADQDAIGSNMCRRAFARGWAEGS